MNGDMTIQQAIHIVAEEATRCKRLANDLADDPLDQEVKCLEHARRYREKGRAMDILLRVARAFERTGME